VYAVFFYGPGPYTISLYVKNQDGTNGGALVGSPSSLRPLDPVATSSFSVVPSEVYEGEQVNISLVPIDAFGNMYPTAYLPLCVYTSETSPACLFDFSVTGGSAVVNAPVWEAYNSTGGKIVYGVVFQDLGPFTVTIKIKNADGSLGSQISDSPRSIVPISQGR
jgi:hypothetical protein